MKGCYSIKLKPGAFPFAISSPRRVPIPLLKQTKAELGRMVEKKVITPVLKLTEWCTPVVIAYEKVMQIPLDEKSSYLTTFGRFRFQRLPFGISSSPEHFQRRMSQMLEGIPGTFCHMDDSLIWGSTQEEHDQRLTEVCNRLKNSSMTLNAMKFILSQTSIKFLGHIIDGQRIHSDLDKIAAIENYQPPTNIKELKQLLVMANYLARFVPNYSDILFPLTSMLRNKVAFVWEAPQEAAFQKLMKILSSNPVLMIFDPGKETTVTTDASSYGLGAIVHIPGNELFAADALSRNPQKVPYKREELEAEIDAFIEMITSSLPASSRRLDELRAVQLKDETCQKLTDYALKGYPSKKEVDTLCATYWQNRYEISVQDRLLMRGCRIIIPKYPEIARLNRLTSAEVINHCKSIFSRHGIPDVVRSDNGSQFDPVKTVEFKDFAKRYGFTHISGSPKFSQSNRIIEAAVKTIKARIKKSRDPCLALMAYRATPLENGFSPSELLMGRRINTTLPVAKTQLQPYSVNKKVLDGKEERRIEGQKTNYEKHHGVRNLDELDPGQNVWITDRRVTGKVLQKTPYPRSYLVQSGKRVYRRNRKHLIPSPDFHPEPEPEDDFDVTGYQHSPADADTGCPPLMSSPQSPKTYSERASSSTKHLLIPM
ncbi:Retrovirus-related Pol polyprotein from transposon 17.6 [Araneus ventricosus]|uniref:Retrovirus-related Pol polyprotein from transposon 17.6 n=1 Tax=Araneus ventricosus TaxID=182803 RepID=A0A4Y2CBJ2_ARAVE|nr:Retrovirus-related Pol polyprotein from transposon 17.6 [Araneus ventricosus]